MASPRNNIHRQQLFHWIGKDIEGDSAAPGKKLTDDDRDKYVGYLRQSIENGLWMMRPQSEQVEVGNDCFEQDLPLTCFTEWALAQSIPHALRYGRLALGFSKRTVLLKGGQPVFKNAGRDQHYAKAMVKLWHYFDTHEKDSELAGLRAELSYLLSFSRAITTPREPIPTGEEAPKPPRALVKERKKTVKGKKTVKVKKTTVLDPFSRRFGSRLDLAEEREWRIALHPTLLKRKTVVAGPGRPPYFIPYEPGKELFTVVLPDSRTVNRVIRDKFFLNELFGASRPHVTVLSFADIGTF